MGTRSVVAKPVGDGFEGRYVHWDGYPSGVGASLWKARQEHFSTVEEMVTYLIDEEPVGWSALGGIDWSLPKGWHDAYDRDEPCADCTLPMWRHYAQYYPEGGPNDPMVNGARRAELIIPGETMQLGHSHRSVPVITGPQSYSCRGETGEQWITSDGDDCGPEWAYVLTPHAMYVFERRFGKRGEDQGHGVGMFGMGASDTDAGGYWHSVAECRWTDEEPDWERLDAGADVVVPA